MGIRPMGERDPAALAQLERQCFSSPWSREAFEEELQNPNAVYLVWEEGAEVLGYGGMRFAAGEFYIDNIAVSPDHRRRGIGRALVEALTAEAQCRQGLFITLEVRPSNTAAVELYRGLGFREAGRRKNFYTKPAEDGLIMTRQLSEEEPV